MPAAARHTFVLYAHEEFSTLRMGGAHVRIVPGTPGTALGTARRFRRPSSAIRLSVFFAPGYTAPLTLAIPTVVLVHDISFVAHPEWFRWREGCAAGSLRAGRAAVRTRPHRVGDRHGGKSFRISGSRRPRFAAFTPESFALKRDVAPQPRAARPVCRLGFQSASPSRLDSGVQADRQEPRRTHGWRSSATTARIPMRTSPRSPLPKGCTSVVDSSVHIRSRLADLYGRARAFALLSEYEGFGHPPLEALRSGVPAVLARHRRCAGSLR